MQGGGLHHLVLQGRAHGVDGLDRLAEQLGAVHIRGLLRIPAFGVVEIRRAGGDAEQVLARLEGEQAEALLVRGPEELAGLGIAPDTDAVGGLDQHRAARPGLADDLPVDGLLAGVLPVLVAGMDMDHRRAGLPAFERRVGDLFRLLGHHRAVAVLLHAAVQRHGYDQLLVGTHAPPLLASPACPATDHFGECAGRRLSSALRTVSAEPGRRARRDC